MSLPPRNSLAPGGLLVAVGPDRAIVGAVAGDVEEVDVQRRRVEPVPAPRPGRALRRERQRSLGPGVGSGVEDEHTRLLRAINNTDDAVIGRVVVDAGV